MGPCALEVADIFRAHGPAWRLAQRSHLSLGQLKVMTAIEQCRTAALGGHLLHCPGCEHDQVSYNSCRNRHCPKCQANAAKRWLEARQADLLPVDYYHVVFTLPAPIADIAYYNKAVVYGLLFEVAAEVLGTIAADPKHLGAQIGMTLVLHTWGSALTHHPHVHGIVPGGGLSPDSQRWVSCKRGFFLSVRVLSRLFRRRFLEELEGAHRAGKLKFFDQYSELADARTFARWLAPVRKCEWVVYAKRPFAGPQAVLAYLSRYTHRVAIANSRLIALDTRGVTAQLGKLCSHRATSALPRPGAPQAIGICHVAFATPAASKPVCPATHVIRPIPASSNRHSWHRGFLPRGLCDARPSWPSGGHWHAYAGGHPTNPSGCCQTRSTFEFPVTDTLLPFEREWRPCTIDRYQGTADIAGGLGGVPGPAPTDR
jgi:hypothetical protein